MPQLQHERIQEGGMSDYMLGFAIGITVVAAVILLFIL